MQEVQGSSGGCGREEVSGVRAPEQMVLALAEMGTEDGRSGERWPGQLCKCQGLICREKPELGLEGRKLPLGGGEMHEVLVGRPEGGLGTTVRLNISCSYVSGFPSMALSLFFSFWLCKVPRPGIEPGPQQQPESQQ